MYDKFNMLMEGE